MNSKTRKAIAAWKQAMQQDLDQLNKLQESGDWSSEQHNRLETGLAQAIVFLNRKFGVCTSFSQGKNVCMQAVDSLGYLVTL